MTKQMTYVQALEIAITTAEGEVKERLEALKVSLEKKATSKKSKVDNSEYVEKMIEVLQGGAKTPTELVALIGVANTQKVASVAKPLIDAGTVVKNTKGKNVTYALV